MPSDSHQDGDHKLNLHLRSKDFKSSSCCWGPFRVFFFLLKTGWMDTAVMGPFGKHVLVGGCCSCGCGCGCGCCCCCCGCCCCCCCCEMLYLIDFIFVGKLEAETTLGGSKRWRDENQGVHVVLSSWQADLSRSCCESRVFLSNMPNKKDSLNTLKNATCEEIHLHRNSSNINRY